MKYARAIATPVLPLVGGRFSPLALFAASEPGGWYDPSDLTTLFQDAAGTTPVTAVEQPVGLVLDKSRGLVLGSELVTNGDFSGGTTGWTSGSSALSVQDGRLVVANAGGQYGSARQSISTVAGQWYKCSCTFVKGTSSALYLQVGTSSGAFDLGYDTKTSASGTMQVIFRATSTTTHISLFNNEATVGLTNSFDNISVRELPGNHLSQSTSTARPVLSARVNLLTQSEDVGNAIWLTNGASKGGKSSVVMPDGSTNGQIINITAAANKGVYQNVTLTPTSYTWSVVLAAVSGTDIARLAYYDGANQSQSSDITVTTTPTRYTCTFTGTSSAGNVSIINGSANAASNIIVWGADLRPSNAGVGLPAYQRVTTATDYDTTGFPLYLKFDGTDDCFFHGFGINGNVSLIAGAVRTGGTNVQGIIGVTPPSTRLVGHILANSVDPNWGAYAGAAFQSSGQSIFNAPAVLVNIAEPSLPSQKLYTNQALSATITGSLYAGDQDERRTVGIEASPGNRYFRGNLYGAIALGRLLTEVERATSTTWMGNKMGLSV